MSDYLREQHKWERRERPRLLPGLLEAAMNGILYFGEKINYELSAEYYGTPPVRKPNTQLDAWRHDLAETWHSN